MTRIAINGFGRIGRTAFRVALEDPSIEIVAINAPMEMETLTHLIQYDSIHGPNLGEAADGYCAQVAEAATEIFC